MLPGQWVLQAFLSGSGPLWRVSKGGNFNMRSKTTNMLSGKEALESLNIAPLEILGTLLWASGGHPCLGFVCLSRKLAAISQVPSWVWNFQSGTNSPNPTNRLESQTHFCFSFPAKLTEFFLYDVFAATDHIGREHHIHIFCRRDEHHHCSGLSRKHHSSGHKDYCSIWWVLPLLFHTGLSPQSTFREPG